MLNLDTIESYKESSLQELTLELKRYFGDISNLSTSRLKGHVTDINKYPRLLSLRNPTTGEIQVMGEGNSLLGKAAVIKGKFFCEHTAAGEATRLGLGNKYTLELDKFSLTKIRDLMINEYVDDESKKGIKKDEAQRTAHEKFTEETLVQNMGCLPKECANISLGTRHMMQMMYDLRKLAKESAADLDHTISQQKMLVVLNEQTSDDILKDFYKFNYFGFEAKNVHFMVQESFNGIDILEGKLFYDETSPKKLHNHGQMAMQKCHDKTIFTLKGGERDYLTFKQYQTILESMHDFLSYNIEDLDYLTSSIDYQSLGNSLKLGEAGFEMVMEVVAQNPIKPQKGGACFFDNELKKVVMVETNRLGAINYSDIHYLNKNFNHYPNPTSSLVKLKKNGLQIPFDIKDDNNKKSYIYPCPIQGDINFLVPTAFVMRKVLKPISNLKSPATIPATIKAMKMQDDQEGFLEMFDKIKEGKI